MATERDKVKRRLKESVPKLIGNLQQIFLEIAASYIEGNEQAQQTALECYMMCEMLEEMEEATKQINSKI